MIVIHIEDCDRDATDRRAADNTRAVPLEVSLPTVPARIEERRQLSRPSVAPSDVGTLMAVAMETGQREVGKNGVTVVLSSNNMVNLIGNWVYACGMRQYSQMLPARVHTNSISATSMRVFHQSMIRPNFLSVLRALAWRIPSKQPALA